MVKLPLTRFFVFLNDLLHQPVKVVVICCMMAFLNLVIDGTLLNLWSLHRNSSQIVSDITETSIELSKLDNKINQSSDPQFIEEQAVNRFNMASQGDLIFLFHDKE